MIDPQNLRLLEALLFASAEPLGEEALKKHFPEGTELEPLVEALTETYAPRGVNVMRVAGGLTLRTAPDLAPRLQLERTVTRRLSRAAIETLAIVAYHQPVTRAEIEEIRGVVLGRGTLDALMEQGWIKPGKRRETPGRPVTWNTTEQFLLHFGLESLRDLPGLEELKASGLLDAKPTSLGETAEAVAEPSESEVEPNEFAPAPEGEGAKDARTETADEDAPAAAGDKTA
jgi:segregation and condensation protein B